jgi:hypothetical protein
MSTEYKKTLDDEIDWKIIDQLHTATVNFSATSLELKKLFFVLLGITIPALIKLSGDKLDLSLFVTMYVLITTFWFFDSFTYFYQEKLREKMDSIFNKIKIRNKAEIILPDNMKSEFTIETVRISKDRVWRSISNISLRFYFVLFIINTVALVLFLNQIIK